MRIVETSDPIIKVVKPEFRSYQVRLNKDELATLQEARDICDKAGELQAKVLERMDMDNNGDDNDFEWARIHLDYIVKETAGSAE